MKNRDFGLLILRLTVGLLMIPHGINKMIHPEAFDFVRGTVEAKDLPLFIAYGVFVGEIIAPLLVVLGFRARIGALIMFINGVATLYLAYSDKLAALTGHGGWAPELPALFFLGAFAIFFTGAGKYSLSHRNFWD